MKLRLKWPEGTAKVECPNDYTLCELRALTAEHSGITPEAQKLFGGFPPKELVGDGDTTALKEVGIQSGDQVTIERRKENQKANITGKIQGSLLQVGDRVVYNSTEGATVTMVHLDDPPDPYYTVRFLNGSERQTTLKRLERVVEGPYT